MSDLIIVARARCRSGRESEMAAALNTNAAASRTEPGCVSYSVIRGAEDPQLFMTIERWRSKADFDSHMKTPHVQTLMQSLASLVAAAPEIVPLVEI